MEKKCRDCNRTTRRVTPTITPPLINPDRVYQESKPIRRKTHYRPQKNKKEEKPKDH